MSTFQLAHISDVHLPLDGAFMPWRSLLNKRLLSYLSWMGNRKHHHLKSIVDQVIRDITAHKPDALAITGDITSLALPAEFERAAGWLNSLDTARVHLIPGNHDALVRTARRSWPRWERWMPPTPEGFPYSASAAGGAVALIGVNTAIPTPPFFASGAIGQAQMARLAELLNRTRHAFRVVMLHHPPHDGAVPGRKALRDRDIFTSVLQRWGAELVLHGHSHRTTATTLRGTDIPVLGIASASHAASSPERAAAWRSIRVERVSGGWRLNIATRQIQDDSTMIDGPSCQFSLRRAEAGL